MDIRENVRNQLQDITVEMLNELDKIIALNIHPETETFEFEIHHPYKLVLYPMGLDNNQIMGERKSENNPYFTGHYPIEIDICERLNYISNYLDESMVIRELVDWFAFCWNKVTNSNFRLASYITLHDNEMLFDLNRNIWIRDYKVAKNHVTDEYDVKGVWIDPDFLKMIKE